MTKSEVGSEKESKEDITVQSPQEKRRKDILYGKGEYRILGKKGEGTFSEVLKCQNIKDGTYWACKKMKQTYDSIDQVNNLREVQAMRRLANHPNILELEEVIFDKKSGTLVLICELMDMNIYELIRDQWTVPLRSNWLDAQNDLELHCLHMGRDITCQREKLETTCTNWSNQLSTCIDHFFHMPYADSVAPDQPHICSSESYTVRRNGIFHRDVKPENILIREDLLKLADFGSCRSIYSKQPYTEYISTRWYRAPECLLTDGYYTYKMDMWSVGCVFFEIMSLHPLFPGSNEVDQIAKIHDVMGTPDPSILAKLKKSRGMNFNFPSKKGTGIERMLPHASTDAVDLIYKLCTYDPDERMTAKQAIRHQYFKDLRESDKRQAALHKHVKQQEKEEQVAQPVSSPAAEKTRSSPKYEKKNNKDSEIQLIASLPKPQSLPAHQLFKDKRKRRRRLGQAHDTTYSSTHGFFPKVPLHASTINPSYHSASFPATFSTHNSSSNQLSLLPSINSTYKSHKNPPAKTKNMFGHYQLPSLDRRGAGF